MAQIALTTIQLIIALGLLNVWLVRANWSTAYRGGNAKTLREEFAVYGLPGWFCTFVGFLKISSAIVLLAGLWIPQLILPAAAMITVLMLGAVSMHAKVKDPLSKALPATAMLIMSLILSASVTGFDHARGASEFGAVTYGLVVLCSYFNQLVLPSSFTL